MGGLHAPALSLCVPLGEIGNGFSEKFFKKTFEPFDFAAFWRHVQFP
jgi:hypothetical protein